jgi:hypothetical protein
MNTTVKEFEIRYKQEINSLISKCPRNDGSIKTLSKRFKWLSESVKKSESLLERISADVLKKHNHTDDDVEMMKEIAKNEIQRLIKKLK